MPEARASVFKQWFSRTPEKLSMAKDLNGSFRIQFERKSFKFFLLLWVIFALMDPNPNGMGSGSATLVNSV